MAQICRRFRAAGGGGPYGGGTIGEILNLEGCHFLTAFPGGFVSLLQSM